jgi:hypothetical protein
MVNNVVSNQLSRFFIYYLLRVISSLGREGKQLTIFNSLRGRAKGRCCNLKFGMRYCHLDSNLKEMLDFS